MYIFGLYLHILHSSPSVLFCFLVSFYWILFISQFLFFRSWSNFGFFPIFFVNYYFSISDLNIIKQKTDSKQTDQPSTSFVNPFFQQKPGLSQPKPGPLQPKTDSSQPKPGSSQPKPEIRLGKISIPLTDIKGKLSNL